MEAELAATREEMGRLKGSKVDTSRVQMVLADLRMQYDLATPAEKAELLQLMFKRLTFHGPEQPVEAELYDRSGVALRREGGGSKITRSWLPGPDSNQRQGG